MMQTRTLWRLRPWTTGISMPPTHQGQPVSMQVLTKVPGVRTNLEIMKHLQSSAHHHAPVVPPTTATDVAEKDAEGEEERTRVLVRKALIPTHARACTPTLARTHTARAKAAEAAAALKKAEDANVLFAAEIAELKGEHRITLANGQVHAP